MRKSIALLILLHSFVSSAQFGTDLDQWKGVMKVEKRAELANKIIFTYRYSSPKTKDSVSILLRDAQKETEQHITDWNYLIYGLLEKGNSNYRKSGELLDTCIQKTRSPYLFISAYLEKAKIHTVLNELDIAFRCYQIALEGARQNNYTLKQTQIYASLGEFNRKTGDFDKGLKYLDSAHTLIRTYDIYDPANISVYDRKSAIYSQLGQPDSVLHYSMIALELAKDMEEAHLQAVSHNELGYHYEHYLSVDTAYMHYDRAIQIWDSLGAYRYLSNAMFNKARLLMKGGQLEKSKKMLFDVEEMCEGKGWLEIYPRLYEHIRLVYQHQGDSVNAYKYYEKATAAHFAVYRMENEKKILEIEFAHEKIKHSNTIKAQEAELQSQKEILGQEERRLMQLWSFLGVAGILLLVLLWQLRETRKNRNQLSQMNERLETALDAKDALIKEVHHRVKNNFQMISSLMTLQAKSITDSEVKEAFEETQSRIHSMSLIHQKLYYGESYDHVNIKDFTAEILNSLAHSDMRTQDIFQIDSPTLFIHIEQAIPLGTIIHELATNSIKHAWKDGKEDRKIILEFDKKDEMFNFRYRDNGAGLPEGFKIEGSKTLGLRLIDLFINRQLQGEVNYYNDNGAVFTFSFKLRK